MKCTEYGTSKYAGFAVDLMSAGEESECTLHLKFWKWYVFIKLPDIIKPKRVWVDLTKYDWATENNLGGPTKKGYWNNIRRTYGFTCDEEAFHIHYGIQPGNWSRDDPKNSDHTKVFFYPWRLEYHQSDVYDANGNWLCAREHFTEWSNKFMDQPHYRGDPDCKHEWVDRIEEDRHVEKIAN